MHAKVVALNFQINPFELKTRYFTTPLNVYNMAQHLGLKAFQNSPFEFSSLRNDWGRHLKMLSNMCSYAFFVNIMKSVALQVNKILKLNNVLSFAAAHNVDHVPNE